jgi:hypothetical protein
MTTTSTTTATPTIAAIDLVNVLEDVLPGIRHTVMTFPERHPDGTRDFGVFRSVDVVLGYVEESTHDGLLLDVHLADGSDQPPRLARFRLVLEQVEGGAV